MTGMEITEVLGNLGDFLGAIAVFGTIVYLAIQVRHSRLATDANTRAIDETRELATAQAFETRQRWLGEWVRAWSMQDDQTVLTMFQLSAGHEAYATSADLLGAIGPEKAEHAVGYLVELLYTMENAFYQHQHGFLDDEGYDTLVQQIRTWVPLMEKMGVPIDTRRKSFERMVREVLTAPGGFAEQTTHMGQAALQDNDPD